VAGLRLGDGGLDLLERQSELVGMELLRAWSEPGAAHLAQQRVSRRAASAFWSAISASPRDAGGPRARRRAPRPAPRAPRAAPAAGRKDRARRERQARSKPTRARRPDNPIGPQRHGLGALPPSPATAPAAASPAAVEHPVQAVLDRPVATDSLGGLGRHERAGGDEVPRPSGCGRPPHAGFGTDEAGDPGQAQLARDLRLFSIAKIAIGLIPWLWTRLEVRRAGAGPIKCRRREVRCRNDPSPPALKRRYRVSAAL
jgi:hypothetical protein